MIAFNLTPSSLLSKNGVSLRNPSLSYQRWFYFCLFLLEQFTCRWFPLQQKAPCQGVGGSFFCSMRALLWGALCFGALRAGARGGAAALCARQGRPAPESASTPPQKAGRAGRLQPPRAPGALFFKQCESHPFAKGAASVPRFRPVSPGGQITPPALRPLPLRARRTRRRAGPALPGAAPPRAGRCPPG